MLCGRTRQQSGARDRDDESTELRRNPVDGGAWRVNHVVSTQISPSQTAESAGVALITVRLDPETVSLISRLAAQHLGASFAGNLPDYLPRNRDVELLKAIQKSDGCLCVINVDGDFELAMETASSLQQLLGERVLLVALSCKSNPGLILNAMRAGFAEFLGSPLNCNEFSDSLLRMRRRWTVGRNAKTGRVLAFLGVRGGAGTTTLVVHLATFLAQLCGKKVLVIDQHRQLGHVGLYLGLPMAEYHFYDLARNIDRVDADLLSGYVVHEVNGVDVLPGPDSLFGLTDVPVSAIQQTIRYLRGTYEFVVIDCCQGVGNANEATIAESDAIYLVATPDVPALRDLSRYVDRLLQYDLPPGKVKVAINRFRSRGEVALKEISEAVRLPVSITVPNSSEELIMAMNTGKPIALGSRSDFAKQMRKWATGLAGSAVENGPGAKRAFAFWK
jgi:pilus assembly protein CpaE